MRHLLVPLVLSLSLLARAHAEEAVRAELSDEVPGHPGVVYLDLVRQVAPDIAAAGAGHLGAELRYLDDENSSAEAGDEVGIDGVVPLEMRAGGAARLVLLVDLGDGGDRAESFSALALFDDSPSPKLLDVADVSYDQYTFFDEPPLLDLSGDDQAIVVRNAHSNSNEDYEVAEILFVRGDRLSVVGTVTLFSDWNCDFEHGQELSLAIVPDPGKPYAGVRADVRDEVRAREEAEGMCGDEEKKPEPKKRVVSATWRWDAAQQKFVADSDALEVLAREDKDRF